MPPKAEKKPTTAGKMPAGKTPTVKKEAGKKTVDTAGDKKNAVRVERKLTFLTFIKVCT